MERFRAEDLEGVHALYAKAWRDKNPFEKAAAGWRTHRAGYLAFFARAKYVGTRIEGEKARIALASPGVPRPTVIRFLKEDGTWRLAD